MKTEFKIFLTGLFLLFVPALFGQVNAQTGNPIGKKEVVMKQRKGTHSHSANTEFRSKRIVREIVRQRHQKKEGIRE